MICISFAWLQLNFLECRVILFMVLYMFFFYLHWICATVAHLRWFLLSLLTNIIWLYKRRWKSYFFLVSNQAQQSKTFMKFFSMYSYESVILFVQSNKSWNPSYYMRETSTFEAINFFLSAWLLATETIINRLTLFNPLTPTRTLVSSFTEISILF